MGLSGNGSSETMYDEGDGNRMKSVCMTVSAEPASCSEACSYVYVYVSVSVRVRVRVRVRVERVHGIAHCM